MSTADERIAAMLCRWAEAKYDVQNVTKVYFDVGQHGPYSEVTPDIDAYVEVSVFVGGKHWRDFEESYSGGLIEDILRFADAETHQRE